MSTLAIEVDPLATDLSFGPHTMRVVLGDGREISVPLEWIPPLRDADVTQRNHWEWIADGVGIHWPDLDVDILVEELLRVS